MILFYVVGFFVSWYLISGMAFTDFRACRDLTAGKYWRSDMGFSIFVGLAGAIVWPLGLLVAWLITGFAEHGVWKVKVK